MAVIETWLTQDLQAPVQVKYLCGSFFSHNGNANRIGVKVYNNGSPVSLSGTVSGYVVLPDGTTVPCTGSLSGNQASVLLPAAAYVPGNICVTIMLTSGSTTTTLAGLIGTVVRARTETQVAPGSVVTDWTNTINAAMQAVIDANTANMATAYESLTYPVPLGAYTIYNNLLYRCISPIASAEAWTASHWTRVKIADDVADLKADLEIAISETTGNEVINFIPEYYINTSGSSVNVNSPVASPSGEHFHYAVLNASEGDIFTITCSGGNAARAWCFIDSNGNALAKAGSNVSVVDFMLIAPANTSKLVLNGKASDNFSYFGELNKRKIDDLNDFIKYTGKNLTETEVLLNRTFYDKGTAASVWFYGLLRGEQNDITVALNYADNIAQGYSGYYARITANYTDSTSSSFDIYDIGKPYHFIPAKTVSRYTMQFVRSSSAVGTEMESKWCITIWKGIATVQNVKAIADANKISEGKKVIFNGRVDNIGTGASYWKEVQLSGYNYLYFAYTDIGGVNTSQSYLLRVNVAYTDNTSDNTNITSQNTLHKVKINKDKIIRTISVVLYRGTMAHSTYAYADVAFYSADSELTAIQAVEQNDLFDLEFEGKAYYSTGPSASSTRISTNLLALEGYITLSVASGYQFSVVQYDDLSYNGYTSIPWRTVPCTIKTDKYFAVSIRKPNDTAISINERYAFRISRVYDPGETTLGGYFGNRIDTKRNPLIVNKSVLTRTIPSGYTTQAGAIFEHYLVQGYSSNTQGNPALIEVYDLNTNTKLYSGTIDVAHFGSASFSNEYYNGNDPMPLLYVSGTNNYFYAVRVLTNGATVIRKIITPYETVRNFVGGVVDSWNNYLYAFGYYAESYRVAEGNYCIVAKYDLSNLTQDGDRYTAELIETYKIPFIYCFQDFEFYRGKIFIASGFNTSESPSKIIVFNPATRSIETTIQISSIQNEPEMIAFRSLTNKDVLYYQSHATTYTVIDFI